MSDGPSVTLKMPPKWRRAVRCAENPASSDAEVASETQSALLADWGGLGALLNILGDVFGPDVQGNLFQDSKRHQIEALRSLAAGHEPGGLLLDCCLQVDADGLCGSAARQSATEMALAEWFERRRSQVRQHCCHETSAAHTAAINKRIGRSCSGRDLTKLASELLAGVSSSSASPRPRQTGVEDGPALPS